MRKPPLWCCVCLSPLADDVVAAVVSGVKLDCPRCRSALVIHYDASRATFHTELRHNRGTVANAST